ncbi:MAG TPA: thiamine diphosphokinase [Firmicutes bacterium]|nr:thiamine diphosphokinase [Bacillota bacterium]
MGHRDREKIGEVVGSRGQPCLIVAADAGAERAIDLGLKPDIIIGDMDSVCPETLASCREAGIPTQVVPCEKDETDSQLALEYCLSKGINDLVFVGAFGGRLDHVLANIIMIAGYMGEERIARAELVGEDGELLILRGPQPLQPLRGRKGQLVSLIPLSSRVTGVNLEGVKWPLREHSLTWGQTLGVSNVMQGDAGWISLRSGVLLVFYPSFSSDEP